MTRTKPLRIAFTNICQRGWIAGCHYLKNLFRALEMLEASPECYLIVGNDTQDDSYEMLLPHLAGVLQYPPRRTFTERARYAVQTRANLPLGTVNPMEYLLREAEIDVVFANKSLGSDFNLPLMIWIPDFQHLHLPQFFSEEESQRRSNRYRDWSRLADRVVLSSQHARNDLSQFAPEQASKARVLNFVAQIEESTEDPAQVAAQYNLPERFFYLPNQFWAHKNHALVVEALALLRESHPEITVVCSGNTIDSRQPMHFNHLLTRIAEAGIHEQFRMLGMIPFPHILPLMRQSIAVINPSLFEGWSTTVEEVKSLGKAILLSDIPVHREQNPPASTFFDPEDANALADAMVQVYETQQPGADAALESAAKEAFPERARAFGEQFLTIAQELVPASE